MKKLVFAKNIRGLSKSCAISTKREMVSVWMGHGPGTSKSVQTSEVLKCAANEGAGMDYKPVCFLSRYFWIKTNEGMSRQEVW